MANFNLLLSGRGLILCAAILTWVTLLLAESSGPPAQIMGLFVNFDKIAHFSAYSVLGLLVCALYFQISPRLALPLLSAPLFISILVGGSEELYQMTVPGRQASLYDLLADSCGAAFSIILANRIAKLSRQHENL